MRNYVEWDGTKFVDLKGNEIPTPYGRRLLNTGTDFIYVLKEGTASEAKTINEEDLFIGELSEGDYFDLY